VQAEQPTDVPHVVPSVRFVAVSAQMGVPVVQVIAPALHALGFVLHACPCVHEMHVPVPLHTMFVPHTTPPPSFPGPSTQVWPPLAHDVTPSLQGFGFVPQELPAVHETQPPLPLHTLLVPHDVPGAALPEPSTHVGPPLAHDVTPALHTFGLPVHEPLALHATQPPLPLHTRFEPHDVPAGIFAALSMQLVAPEPHDVMPT
jgi:hypothetical protein